MLRFAALALVVVSACKDKPKPAAAPPAQRAPAPAPAPAPGPSPALAAAEPPATDDGLDRPPTPGEVDRCARLYIVAARCGYAFDHEVGWYPSTHRTTLGDNVARRACAVDKVTTDDGPQMPMPRYDAAAVAQLAGAADCDGFVSLLRGHGPVRNQR
jgi:hypothetical protein